MVGPFLALFFLNLSIQATSQTCDSLGIVTKEQTLDSQLFYSWPYWVKSPTNGPYKTVLVRTRLGKVFRSNDTGATWEALPLDGLVRAIIPSPDDKGVILLGSGSEIWVSENEAKDFKKVTTPGRFLGNTFRFHPRHPGWVLAISSGNCQNNRLFNCSNDLYLSQDMGVHWGLLRTYVWNAAWHGIADRDQLIIVWERRAKTGNMYNEPTVADVGRSDTFWRDGTSDTIASDAVGFLVLENHIFIAQLNARRTLILKASSDMGETFHIIEFPTDLDEYRYRILDASEGSTYVGVIHSRTADYANVYGSNAFDTEFTLELEFVKCPGGYCDFDPVEGIEGVYIANQFRSVNPTTDTGVDPHTLISFDKGAEWSALPVPKGKTAPLQLQGPSSDQHVSYYSAAQAVGIIFANGNVGPVISNDLQDIGVYFSRDAGWSWSYVEPKPHIYEFGNRGALVIMVLNEESTNEIQYSLDEGITWNSCTFGETFEVINIVSDPDFGTRHFLMYGNRGNVGVLVSLDFSGIHERECLGWENPGSSGSDYEYWYPSDRDSDDCLLGRKSQYIRRKQAAKCFNPLSFTQTGATVVQNCSCTDENYECSYCFVRSADERTCVPDREDTKCQNYDPKVPPEPCVGVWAESQGYQRVPGDTCDPSKGVNWDPIVRPCPNTPPSPHPQPNPQPGAQPQPQPQPQQPPASSSPRAVVVILVILLMIAVAIGVVWYLAGHNPTVRSYVERIVPERFLPELTVAGHGDYSAVSLVGDDDIEYQDDAREVNLSEDDKSTSS